MSLDYYTALLTDRPRIEAFREAILAEVKPGDRVLDVGSGSSSAAPRDRRRRPRSPAVVPRRPGPSPHRVATESSPTPA